MSLATISALSECLKSYCKLAEINYVQIVFHGGEPLLLSKEYFISCINIFKNTCPDIEFGFTIQTNGVTLDQEWYALFQMHQVKVGISIDGPKQYHDTFRIFHNGKGSYDQVAEAVRLGKDNGLSGILMVMNTKIPTIAFYQELKALGVASLNLLFPDGHYDKLPDGFNAELFGNDSYTPYAEWLIQLFMLWKKDKDRPGIKFFETLIEMVYGNLDVGNQAFGRRKNGIAVIESDGGIEVVDSLRACYEGITRNLLNVHTSNLEDLFSDPIFQVFYHSHDRVAEQCLNCPIYDFCGGGFLGSRFANANGFNNPTIYCRDIIRLVSFIQNDFINSLPVEVVSKMDVEMLSYTHILQELRMPASIKIDPQIEEQLISFKQSIAICT